MKPRKRTAIVGLALAGLLISSGIALADPLETEEEATEEETLADTLFSFGYDLINGLVLWNISSIDEPCALPSADDGEETEDADPEEEALPDCELTSGEVAGPNGQVNHGMFMKLFNSLYDGNARGCVIRHLAQSELGKGDQQVKVGDVAEETETDEVDTEATVEFTTIETVCQHGSGNGDIEADGTDGGKGKPPWAGKPEGKGKPASPGKSGSAPGQNK